MAYLAGDIGGTNCRFLLVKAEEKDEVVIAEKTYPSNEFSALTTAIKRFLSEVVKSQDNYPKVGCLAVAGPVTNNTADITNLKWKIDGNEMAKELKIGEILIVNDFAGIGYGLLAMEDKDVIKLNNVPPVAAGVKACIGAGTGLGETFLTWNGSEYDVWPTEGGHADFSPRDQTEFELMEFIKKNARVPRVSVERVVSGLGIPMTYQYFAHKYPAEISDEVERKLRSEDPGQVIATYAKEKKCGLCERTMDTFVAAYGGETGNLALKTLPFGGMYIAGGIAPKILWAIEKDHNFWNNFIAKGRMQGLLEKVPVYIVTHNNPGLLGAQVLCRRMLRKRVDHEPVEPVKPVRRPRHSLEHTLVKAAVVGGLISSVVTVGLLSLGLRSRGGAGGGNGSAGAAGKP